MADPRAEKTDGDDDAQQTSTGTGTAVLDPPEAEDTVTLTTATADDVMLGTTTTMPVRADWRMVRGQTVTYFADEQGRMRGADLLMWSDDGKTYRACIRWEDGVFRWYEPDASAPGGWVAVKRGQHLTQLAPIVEQAQEYAISRVFGGWVT